eukprot:s3514_g1.t1
MALSQLAQDEIMECLKHADDAGQLVQASAKLMEVLHRHQMCRVVRLKPDEVGVHKQNRDGFGICPKDCHTLLGMIASVGWDAGQCNAVCTEVAAGDGTLEFNEALVASSAGLLPAVNKTQLRFASLSCSHTNAALRCALHETPSEEELVSLDKHISMSKIQSLDKALYEAANNGMERTLIHWDAMAFSPKIAQLIHGLQCEQPHRQRRV